MRAQAYPTPYPAALNTSRLKMKNPESFDGKKAANFNQWWEAVTMYLGFYPETVDRQKIAWVGTLLMDTALAWHLHWYRELQNNDTWVNYSAAIRAEYHNDREAADAQHKLGQLRYLGCIRTYMMEFRALNNYAQAAGEGLREKIDLAMPSSILDMRFNQNPEEPATDEHFLQATHRAGLQVEKRRALQQAREQWKAAPVEAGKKKKERRDHRQKDDRTTGSNEKEKRDINEGRREPPKRKEKHQQKI